MIGHKKKQRAADNAHRLADKITQVRLHNVATVMGSLRSEKKFRDVSLSIGSRPTAANQSWYANLIRGKQVGRHPKSPKGLNNKTFEGC